MFNSLKDVIIGKQDDIIVLAKSIENRKTKTGGDYQHVTLRDTEGNEVTALKFDSILSLETPTVVKLRIEGLDYQGNLSYKILSCETVNNVSITDFLPKSRIDPNQAWKEIIDYIKEISRPGLGRVVCALLSTETNRYKIAPLNPTGAYSRQSGLLEATLNLTKLVDLSTKIQNLDRDLMIAGSLIYYIGNLDTVDLDYNYNPNEILFGPELIGYKKIQLKVAEMMASGKKDVVEDLVHEDVELLSHILVCRGKGIKPTIPEAVYLKNLNRIIQEIDAMNESLANATPNSVVVDNHIYNNKLYKRS